jgi:hypothetical protein
MKRKSWLFSAGLLLIASVAAAASVTVITQQAMLRQDKRFFAPVVTRVPYGESLHVLGSEGDWLRVYYQNEYGWIHTGEVVQQKITFSTLTAQPTSGTTQDEVALAGKGFTPEVEEAFREKNPSMRFNLVDEVESFRVSDKTIRAFIEKGNLKEPGGA